MSPGSCKNCYPQTIRSQIIYLIDMYKQDLALNISQRMIYRKYNQPTNHKYRVLNSGDRAYISKSGCARGVMIIVVGNGHDDTSSNPG